MRRGFRYLGILVFIAFLIGLAGSSYEFVRLLRITDQLSSIKSPDPKLVPQLVRRLQDYNPLVRAEAAKALAGMGAASQAATPELVQALDDSSAQVRCNSLAALAHIGAADDAQVAKFIAGLSDPNSEVRRYSIFALRMNAKNANSAIPKLIELLDDPLIAGWAAGALGEIGPAATSAVPKMMTAMAKETDLRRLEYIAAFEKLGAASKPALPLLQPLTQDPDPLISQAATKAIQAITTVVPNPAPQ